MANLISQAEETALLGASLEPVEKRSHPTERRSRSRFLDPANVVLALALCASVASWLSTIRSALWLDETISYWQISGGLSKIWARQGLSSAAYGYILWATNSLFGSNEVVLRMPSVLAMLAATYVLYRIAREFFSSDVAAIVAVIFCLHPTVAFAAVDARPYGFAILVVNCAIFTLVRWMKENSAGYAILFGVFAAGIFYFHFLFGVILPALALIFLVSKGREWKRFAPQLTMAGVPFVLILLPMMVPLFNLLRTSQSHVFDRAPGIPDLLFTIAPGHVLAFLLIGTALAAALLHKLERPDEEALKAGFACFVLAAVPLGILYGVSTLTSVHVFVDRYRLVAVPGVALCWGFLVSRFASKAIRVGSCAALVLLTFSSLSFALLSMDNPHGYSWKYALDVANKAAAMDNAPLLICSDLPESNFQPMPANVYAATNGIFAPLSYYKVHSPVIPLPRALNDEAKSQINKFLATATPAHQRFLVLGFIFSGRTFGWITQATKGKYTAHNLGTTDGVTVMEYRPL